MAKNDLILLDSCLDAYQATNPPFRNRGQLFEFFAIGQILKDYAFSESQILSGSVDGRNDGGIDDFFILVNGHLAEDIPKDFWPRADAKLELFIITCKHEDSFKQIPVEKIIATLAQLFDFNISSGNLADTCNELLLKKRDILIETYRRLAFSLKEFNINIIYTCRGSEDSIEKNIQAKARQAEDTCRDFFSNCNVLFSFWGNSRLLEKYREQPISNLTIECERYFNQKEQYVVLATLTNFFSFITDSEGRLNRHLFDANVRDYLGLNPVNKDICESLENKQDVDFWWLNNGITIIGSKVSSAGNLISIENPQIVNGLQTSESIYNYFSSQSCPADSRSVLIRIIISRDSVIYNDIIYATNNQTNVNVTALRANDKVQRDIEDILRSHGIFYERRQGQNRGLPDNSNLTPLALAAGYICLIKKDPLSAARLRQKFMRDSRKYEEVFSRNVDLSIWYPLASLIKKNDMYLLEWRQRTGYAMGNFLKNYRQIVLFMTVARLFGSFCFGEKQLISFDVERFTYEEVEKSLQDIADIQPDLLKSAKKLKSHMYQMCFAYISAKYKIRALEDLKYNHYVPGKKEAGNNVTEQDRVQLQLF